MKRPHDGEKEDEEPPTCKPHLESPEESNILRDFQTNLLKKDLNEHVEERLMETQKRYFTAYMAKLMHQIPMGRELVSIIDEIGEEANQFEYTLTAAKSVINTQNRVRQIKAYHAVFDMVYGLFFRYAHEKVLSPTLSKILSKKQLGMAYEKYQSCCQVDEDASVLDMQCLLYYIQEMLENKEPVKIPNPVYSRFTQQIKAMSEYAVMILSAMAKPANAPMEEDFVEEPNTK